MKPAALDLHCRHVLWVHCEAGGHGHTGSAVGHPCSSAMNQGLEYNPCGNAHLHLYFTQLQGCIRRAALL